MTYSKDREQFIATVAAEGLPVSVIRAILAKANTLQRIAELSCSSEAADRDRVPCPGRKNPSKCICDYSSALVDDSGAMTDDGRTHYDVPRIDVQEARIKRNLESMMACRSGFKLNFQGDPRGAVVKLAVPSGKYDDMGREGLCVPSKGLPASFWERNR